MLVGWAYSGSGYSTGWSFGLGIAGAVFMLISGIAYTVICKKNDYTTKPVIPCKSQVEP